MRRLVIPRALLDEVLRHAAEAAPDEACGILGGREGRVERVFRMKNAAPSPVSFILEPKEQLSVMKRMEDEGLVLLAIYHSHPASAAYPSAVDVERAFFPGTDELSFPDVFYVIAGFSGGGPEAKAYIIGADRSISSAELVVG